MDENCKRQKEVERTYGGLLPAVEGHSLGTRYIFGRKGLFRCKVFLYRAYILEQSSLDKMKGI